MTTDRDPPRLHEGTDVEAGVREVLRAGKDELPDAARLDRILSGLRANVPGGDGGQGQQGQQSQAEAPRNTGDGGTAPGATKGGLGGVTKIAATTIAAGAIGVFLATRGETPRDVTPAPSPSARSSAPLATPATASEVTPSAQAAEVPVVAIDSLPQASVAPASPRAPAASAAIAGPSEMSVLKEAQDALASDPARSLELTKTHERAFPRGGFAEEREVIRIDALMRLGRSTDARERAKAFYVRFPDSAHRARIEALLAK